MIGNFSKAYDIIRVYEGGNDDDPQDPGGRTSRGITQAVYTAYRRRKGLGEKDVWNASEAEVKEIYKVQYWQAIKGDELPSGVDLFVYDSAVNSGPSQATKWLQRALGVPADGQMGQRTLEAADSAVDNDAIVDSMADQRERFLRNLKTFKRFGNGWMKRVNSAKRISQAWADGSVGETPVRAADMNGNKKSTANDIALPRVSQETGMTTAAGSGAASAALETVQNTTGMLQNFDSIKYVQYGLIALAVLAFFLTLYAIWKTKKAKEAVA